MILFLHGPDSYRLNERLSNLKQGFTKKYDKAGFNVAILDGADLTMADFRKAAFSSGLFAKKRLVVIKNIFSSKNPSWYEELAGEIVKTNQDNILIVTSAALPKEKNNPLLKILKKADKTETFPLLKDGEVYRYILEAVKKRGAYMDNEAVSYLVEAVHSDLWRLNNELDKLTSYKKRIAVKDVDLFMDSPLDKNVFNFMDALSHKNTKQALKLLHDQLDSGAHELYLLTMLARQVKILLAVKETNGQGLMLHPFVVKKALAQVSNFSLPQLKNLFAKIIDIDNRLKSSRGTPKLLLDLFVVEMCQ